MSQRPSRIESYKWPRPKCFSPILFLVSGAVTLDDVTGAKDRGVLGSAMTYGVKRAKPKAVIAGQRASTRGRLYHAFYHCEYCFLLIGRGRTLA